MLFGVILKSLIRQGTLELITAKNKHYLFGNGTLPHVTIKLHRRSLEWSLGLNPQLKIGEAYMDGLLTIEKGTVRDFLRLLLRNFDERTNGPMLRFLDGLRGRLSWFKQLNPPGRARRNAARAYDLPDQIYSLFLDADRQYSCGYFTDFKNSLDESQLDKKHHLASKLFLNKPGLKVLDIGSGWGGLGLYLAREAACQVKGITLSVEQYKYSNARARAAGVAKTCRFELRDYRQETGPYDRIVSVGMFEHVGKKNYDDFFARIGAMLAEDGVCLVHAIGRFSDPGQVNAFIRKHIFPGTDIAVLSEVLAPIERARLYVTDIEILRLHYAETLRHWSERFQAHKAQIMSLYGDRFYRKWEFYLISCEMGFRFEQLMVFQIQLSKSRNTVPLTRDYMVDWERRHRAGNRTLSLPA